MYRATSEVGAYFPYSILFSYSTYPILRSLSFVANHIIDLLLSRVLLLPFKPENIGKFFFCFFSQFRIYTLCPLDIVSTVSTTTSATTSTTSPATMTIIATPTHYCMVVK